MIEAGEVRRHTRRVLKVYAESRRVFAELLTEIIEGLADFTLPEGGLAVWLRLADRVDPEVLPKAAAERRLRVYPGAAFSADGEPVQGLRLGFARLNPAELAQGVARLKLAALRSLR